MLQHQQKVTKLGKLFALLSMNDLLDTKIIPLVLYLINYHQCFNLALSAAKYSFYIFLENFHEDFIFNFGVKSRYRSQFYPNSQIGTNKNFETIF